MRSLVPQHTQLMLTASNEVLVSANVSTVEQNRQRYSLRCKFDNRFNRIIHALFVHIACCRIFAIQSLRRKFSFFLQNVFVVKDGVLRKNFLHRKRMKFAKIPRRRYDGSGRTYTHREAVQADLFCARSNGEIVVVRGGTFRNVSYRCADTAEQWTVSLRLSAFFDYTYTSKLSSLAPFALTSLLSRCARYYRRTCSGEPDKCRNLYLRKNGEVKTNDSLLLARCTHVCILQT